MNQTPAQQARSQLMLQEKMLPLLFRMAIPTIVAMLITSVYNMADTYFVHYLGTSATGAVGVNFSMEQIIMMAGSFLAVGANSFIARLLGAGNREKANQILSTAFFTAIAFGLVVAILGLIFIEDLVVLLGATPTVKPYAVDYGKYLLYAAPFMTANFVMNQCLRSEGSAMYSMLGMAAGGILNIILDPIFIFVFDLGIAGAAIATSVSKLVSFVILILPYLRKKSVLTLSVRHIRYTAADSKEVITVGSSSLFRSLLGVVSAIFINNVAGSYSDSCLAALSVTNKIMMVPFSIFLGFGQGFQPICGFNWGARRYDRIIEGFRLSTIITAGFATVLAVIISLFAEPIIFLFTEADLEIVRIGRICLITQCVALPVHAWGVVVNMLYAGLGKAVGAFLMSISRQGLFFFPVALVLPRLMDELGVACVQGAADFLTLALALPLAIKGIRELRGLLAKQTAA